MTPDQKDLLEASVKALVEQSDWRRALSVALEGEGGLPGYGPEFRRYLYKKFPAQEAEDVFSQFVQNLCASLPSFRKESSFRTWAYTLLTRTAIHMQQEAQRHPATVPIRSGGTSSSVPYQSPEHAVSESRIKYEGSSPSSLVGKKEEKETLDRLINLLSPPEKKLLLQVAGEGMTYEEIALLWSEERGQEMSPAAVRQRYFRLREKLKRLAGEKE